LTFEVYQEICKQNHVETREIQVLLLKYFNTIGVITWFGETYLNFLHVLSPAWITQGVYKIITARKTALLYGQIKVTDFPELLFPTESQDYTYEEHHYGYLQSMMDKFDLCHIADDQNILIPSAFGKEPKLEYSEFKGENVRTYIFQFEDYMPMALIHRFISRNLQEAYDNNYWYSGIVMADGKSETLAMVQADKEAKRIYIRIKGNGPLGQWEHIRRALDSIIKSYANIKYKELVALEEDKATVDYEDLLSYLQAGKSTYFHPKLGRDFNVGYLMGLFENKEETISKYKDRAITFDPDKRVGAKEQNEVPPVVVHILNNNTSNVQVSSQIQNQINIDIQVISEINNGLQEEANYLLSEVGSSNKELKDALEKLKAFSDATENASDKEEIKRGGWGRRLKKVISFLKSAKDQVKNINDGRASLESLLESVKSLAVQFDLTSIVDLLSKQ